MLENEKQTAMWRVHVCDRVNVAVVQDANGALVER